MKRIFTQPKSLLIVFGISFLLNLIVFGQAQNAPKNSLFESAGQAISFITSFVTFIGLLTAVGWYFWKGKDAEQAQKAADEWEKVAAARAARIGELEAVSAKQDRKIKDLEAEEEKLRKANLRLQGLSDE